MPAGKPKALLVQPPVYDFALYDLYLKPVGLLQVGRMLADAGYDTCFVNGLDYTDPVSAGVFGRPRRKSDGTGKFFRERIDLPERLQPRGRAYARYGLHRDVFSERIAAAFAGAPPDIALIGTGMTYWYQGVREAARRIRDVYPGVPVVAGGVYATLLPEHCRDVCEVDEVVKGPAIPGLQGITERYGLPSVGTPSPGYRVLMEEQVWKDAGALLLNRGCPFSCAYCASELVSGTFTPGDPEVLFQTALAMHTSFGTRNFAFYDDALLVRKDEVLYPFLDLVRGAGLPCSFYLPNAVHVSMLDGDTALRLRRGGFREIRLGFESSSPDFHSRLDGKLTGESLDRALEALAEAGFSRDRVTLYILAGLPGQEAGEVEASVEYAIDRRVRVSVSEYSPVPGSSLWRKSVEHARVDLAGEPLYQNNTFFPMEWTGFTAEDLSRLKKRVREHNARLCG